MTCTSNQLIISEWVYKRHYTTNNYIIAVYNIMLATYIATLYSHVLVLVTSYDLVFLDNPFINCAVTFVLVHFQFAQLLL